MNIERVHAIALEVKKEVQSLRIIKILNQLASELQNQINQPQQPSHQEQVANARKTLNESLITAPSNDFSPAWNQALDELNIRPFVGRHLSASIDAIFLNNTITPQVALKEIQELTKSVQDMFTSLEQLINGFNYFSIGHEVLDPGDAELGILVPRTYLDNRFDKFSKELKELNSILSVLSEVATGSSEHFEIGSLSTTDPFIVLGAGLGVLSTIALAIKPIISAYKEILEVRLLHAQLAEKNIAAERLKGIEEHAEEIMGKAIEEIKQDLLSRYPLGDQGRRNELSNALGPALKKLANRVDRGFNIEVRVQPIVKTEDEEDAASEEDQANIQAIQSAMKEMEFMKLEGEPILHLPESTDDE